MTCELRIDPKMHLADVIVQDPYDLLPFGAFIIDQNLDVYAWNSTLTDWTGITKATAITSNLEKLFPGMISLYLKDRLTDVFDHGHNVVLSPALHKSFISSRPTEASHGIQAIQKTQIRPALADRRFALVIIEDVTAELQQTEKLRRDRHALKLSEARLIKNQDELRDAKQEADAASRAKSEFLSNMSHEIRTPMTAILGFADILRENCHDQGQIEALDTIKRNGDHLLDIINDILDISKIEAGKMALDKVACSPQEVVSEVVSLMRVRADAKGLSLLSEPSGLIPESIRSDPHLLRQILINTVGNAIKFTETGSVHVIMKLITPDNGKPFMQFDVKDTGIGMDEEQASHLFQPFVQADSSTSRKFGGTGLGLAISKRMAEMLGGGISLTSIPGQGSTFSATIDIGPIEGVRLIDPASYADAAREKSLQPAKSANVRLDCRILLAEDGIDNQRLIDLVLKKAGADVALAENGQIAVEKALAARDAGKSFDTILMDMQMPILDGYEATQQLREAGYDGTIIALTAHAMTSDRQKCLEAGCDDYTTKPIDREKLIELVHSYTSS